MASLYCIIIHQSNRAIQLLRVQRLYDSFFVLFLTNNDSALDLIVLIASILSFCDSSTAFSSFSHLPFSVPSIFVYFRVPLLLLITRYQLKKNFCVNYNMRCKVCLKKSSSLRQCSRCKSVQYCSTECQRFEKYMYT